MRKIIALICACIATYSHAQTIKIKDKESRRPIELVALYNSSQTITATSNQKGIVDISSFSKNDTIFISCLGFKTSTLVPAEIASFPFILYLETAFIDLESVVISASRIEQYTRDVPQKITAITASDVMLGNPQTAADLLASSGEVFVQKSQLGGGSPMIRGFATNRVLISVDGVRMNNAIFRSGNIQNVISISAFNLERTEILYGPGAVMYGSDAIGGAMNFYSLTPKLSTTDKIYAGLEAATRYSSANNEQTAHIAINAGLKKWASLTTFSFSKFGDLLMGSRGPDSYLRETYQCRVDGKDSIFVNPNPQLQKLSAYSQTNLMQKLRFAPNKKTDIAYGFHYSTTSNVPRYDRLIETRNDKLRDAEWYYGPQLWIMNNIRMNYLEKHKLFDRITFIAAHQIFEESRHNRAFGQNTLSHRWENIEAVSVNIDFDKKISEKHSLLYGLEYINNNVSSFAEFENIENGEIGPLSTRYPDGSNWMVAAVYANSYLSLSEKLSLQCGLRYNYTSMNAVFDTTFFAFPFTESSPKSSAPSGSIGLAYNPTKQWNLSTHISTGFRAPNIDDIGKVFDSEPGNVTVPNPSLKPEYAYNIEGSINRVISDVLKIGVNAYYTILHDAIVRRNFQFNGNDSIIYDGHLSRVLSLQNAAKAHVKGIQAGVDYKLPLGFAISSRFTWQNGEEELDDGEKAPLRHAVPWFGSSHLVYSVSRLKIDFSAVYQSEVAYSQMPPSEIAKPHLYTADNEGNPFSPKWITLNIKAISAINDNITLSAGIENITDKRYRPYSSGITAAGRNFLVSLRVSL